MSEQKQLALIGCAHIHTPGFVKRLQARDDVKVTYVWDHDADRAAKWVGELGSKQISDPAVAYSDSQISGVIICSETNRHEELILPAAAARKHLFVEKPLGIGADDAQRMAKRLTLRVSSFKRAISSAGCRPISLSNERLTRVPLAKSLDCATATATADRSMIGLPRNGYG